MNSINDLILNHHVLRKLIEMNLVTQSEVRRLISEEMIDEASKTPGRSISRWFTTQVSVKKYPDPQERYAAAKQLQKKVQAVKNLQQLFKLFPTLPNEEQAYQQQFMKAWQTYVGGLAEDKKGSIMYLIKMALEGVKTPEDKAKVAQVAAKDIQAELGASPEQAAAAAASAVTQNPEEQEKIKDVIIVDGPPTAGGGPDLDLQPVMQKYPQVAKLYPEDYAQKLVYKFIYYLEDSKLINEDMERFIKDMNIGKGQLEPIASKIGSEDYERLDFFLKGDDRWKKLVDILKPKAAAQDTPASPQPDVDLSAAEQKYGE